LVALSLAACGDDRPLPDACTSEPGDVRSALAAAPSPVRVHGTLVSTCVRTARTPDELQRLGTSLVGAAGELADSARARPGGQDEVSLGYLVGAARRGAGKLSGERSELVRRLEQEAQVLRGDKAAYRRGVEAGRRSG
jgi:hypothetical protein